MTSLEQIIKSHRNDWAQEIDRLRVALEDLKKYAASLEQHTFGENDQYAFGVNDTIRQITYYIDEQLAK